MSSAIQDFLEKNPEFSSDITKNINELKNVTTLIGKKADNPSMLEKLCYQFENRTRGLVDFSDVKIEKDFLKALSNDIKNLSHLKIYDRLESSVLKNIVQPIVIKEIVNHFVGLAKDNETFDKVQIDNSIKFIKELLTPLCKTKEQKVALDRGARAFVTKCAKEIGTIKTEKLSFMEKIKTFCKEFLGCIFPYMKVQDHNKQIEEVLGKKEVKNVIDKLKHATKSKPKENSNRCQSQSHENVGRGI